MRAGGSGEKKRSSALSIAFGLFVLSCFAGAVLFAFWSSCPLPENSLPVTVIIEPGASTREIADILHKAEVIRNPFLFRMVSKALRADGKMHAGEFCFEESLPVWDVISDLIEGRIVYHTLTVREGVCVEEIATLIEDKGYGDKEKILEIAKDASLVSSFATAEELSGSIYPLEGYLFPDTYNIQKGASEEQLVSMMIDRFCQIFTQELIEKASQMGLSVHQVSTLAALVEKEAVVDEERPIIAAVYLNRLSTGMLLGADPTVLYALGRFNGTLLWKELEIDSPYNTYKYPGLPPGPISNFGQSSLKAVLAPAAVDYLYFVSKNDGTHAFAYTLSEHNRNIAIYQNN